MVTVGDHYRPSDDDRDGAVYRVVGVTDEVTLLRVTSGDGRRVHTGTIERVPRESFADAFEPASDPDARFSLRSTARNALSGVYWSIRRFV